jgi:hypothetical protein
MEEMEEEMFQLSWYSSIYNKPGKEWAFLLAYNNTFGDTIHMGISDLSLLMLLQFSVRS